MRFPGMLAGLAMLSALAACGGPPPAPPTVVNVSISTTADNNPTTDNKAAPLALRVYQLAGTANFSAAEFFPLYNDDTTALKSDLVHRDDFLMAPQTTKSESILPRDGVTAIGVFGAYRGFQTATWHVSVPVVAHQVNTVTVTAGHDGLVIKVDAATAK